MIGAFSTRLLRTSCRNTGVSRMPRRIHNPMPTSTIDSMNGTRQPQVANASPDSSLKASTARFARKRPAGTPNCGHDAISPRCPWVRDHSMAIKTEPPHSPPTPMPCSMRSTVRITAPQMPIVS
jgi:hypothetical protein